MNAISIKTAADARSHIGKRVYWDDISNRYCFLRSGIVDEVLGRQICVDGNWHMMSNLTNLRNYENGGYWKKLSWPEETEATRKYGLTLAEARIFAVLQTGFISSDQMSELIGRNSNWHFTRSAAVHISNIRRKTGLDIKSVRGKGYALTNLNNS